MQTFASDLQGSAKSVASSRPSGPSSGGVGGAMNSKSYCKVADHGDNEIMFACYQCRNTYCHLCLDAHRNHRLIYFKDPYIVLNYDNVKPLKPEEKNQYGF